MSARNYYSIEVENYNYLLYIISMAKRNQERPIEFTPFLERKRNDLANAEKIKIENVLDRIAQISSVARNPEVRARLRGYIEGAAANPDPEGIA